MTNTQTTVAVIFPDETIRQIAAQPNPHDPDSLFDEYLPEYLPVAVPGWHFGFGDGKWYATEV